MSTVFQYRYILLCLLLAVFHASADSLTLSYDGNRLTGVTEAAADYDVTGSFEYKRARGSQYLYDSNGSLVADKSRGIVYITYDVNGNPSGIYFTNGNVTKYLYSASGQKLRSVYYTAMPYITRTFGVQPPELEQWQTQYADSTDYLFGGSLVMKNGRIDKCLFNGGYARAMSTGSTTDRFVFYYYNKDHLGNNREVVDVRGRLHQVTNYYPCGAPYADPAALSGVEHQPYKYNGKELDLMHGLNTYDYGARQYDPILARWDRIDPLAEKYYNVSPYAYCAGDPVNAIDKEGNDITFLIASKGAQEHGHMAAIIGNQSRYYYITAGTGDSDYSIYSNSGQHGILAIYSIEASSMDKAISIVRNNDTNNSYYDDFVTFSTSSKMDENMLSTAYAKQIKFQTGEEEYRLFTNNCADIVKDIFEEGTNVDLHMGISPRPNDNFENIKENKIEIQYDIYNELENENKK